MASIMKSCWNELAAKALFNIAKSRSSWFRNFSKDCKGKAAPKIKIPYLKNNDCTKIPAIGLGTYKALGCECERAVADAIDVGYRHIDTAYYYENEKEVGKAIGKKICEGVVKREDIYITAKLWCHFHEADSVEYAFNKSLKSLGLDYIDLYLMHWPYSYVHRGDDVLMPKKCDGEVELSDVDYLETWCAMEKLVETGKVKSIGVSNFNSKQLARLLGDCKIKPVHNQIECHPGLNQKKLIEICKVYNILVTAYCPLGHPDPKNKKPAFLFHEKTKKIAEKYKKTPAQVVLRYVIEQGTIPIPKSVNKNRMTENLQVFDFKLSRKDHKILDSFHTGERVVPMTHAVKSKHYPFHIEY